MFSLIRSLVIHTASKVILCAVAVLFLAVYACNSYVQGYESRIQDAATVQPRRVGLVLGAGVNNRGEPYDELKSRLDVAASAYKQGKVEKLLLSGDNRYVEYNEPLAMQEYLIETHAIPTKDTQNDYAGRSTYESCERAKKVFGVNKAIIFSAGTHLPRAIYLCEHFGIESYGIASSIETNNAFYREPLARVKAVYNVFVYGEDTVLGDKINL